MTVNSVLELGLAAYDELPYGSRYDFRVSPQAIRCNPVFSTTPANIDNVCDVACGSGRHLIASALVNPECRFHGVDGSQAHIDAALNYAHALRLDNITFERIDVREWEPSQDCYDLMTCSGTFSWVPADVQLAILRAMSLGLRHTGIAAIHVLTRPGSDHLIHAQAEVAKQLPLNASIRNRLAAIREYARTLATETTGEEGSRRALVDQTILNFLSRDDAGLPHEFLATPISAFYLRDFEGLAREFDLAIVGDASAAALSSLWLPSGPIKDLFERTHSWLEQQELLDMFGANPGSRRILLSKSLAPSPNNTRTFDSMHISLTKRAVSIRSGSVLNIPYATVEPLGEEALAIWLAMEAAFPESVSVDELSSQAPETLLRTIERLDCFDLIQVSNKPTRLHSWKAGYPETYRLTRAELDTEERDLTSSTGYYAPVFGLVKYLLTQANGSRSITQLATDGAHWLSQNPLTSHDWKRMKHWGITEISPDDRNGIGGGLPHVSLCTRLLSNANKWGYLC
jgi:Methyltransferase domain